MSANRCEKVKEKAKKAARQIKILKAENSLFNKNKILLLNQRLMELELQLRDTGIRHARERARSAEDALKENNQYPAGIDSTGIRAQMARETAEKEHSIWKEIDWKKTGSQQKRLKKLIELREAGVRGLLIRKKSIEERLHEIELDPRELRPGRRERFEIEKKKLNEDLKRINARLTELNIYKIHAERKK